MVSGAYPWPEIVLYSGLLTVEKTTRKAPTNNEGSGNRWLRNQLAQRGFSRFQTKMLPLGSTPLAALALRPCA
jgi:hypothetical protein